MKHTQWRQRPGWAERVSRLHASRLPSRSLMVPCEASGFLGLSALGTCEAAAGVGPLVALFWVRVVARPHQRRVRYWQLHLLQSFTLRRSHRGIRWGVSCITAACCADAVRCADAASYPAVPPAVGHSGEYIVLYSYEGHGESCRGCLQLSSRTVRRHAWPSAAGLRASRHAAINQP